MPSKKTLESLKNEIESVWGDRYEGAPNASYVNTNTKIPIICKEHGIFYITPHSLLAGHGCKECRREKLRSKRTLSNKDVINNIIKIHGDKYDLSKINYVNARTKITPICKKHGLFSIRYSDLIYGHGCPICGNNISNTENEIYKLVKSYCSDAIHNDRNIIKPFELDIYIPSKNMAIEYNGLKWHSEEFNIDKNYHLKKLEECNSKGIKLIQIFEDEWLNNKNIVVDKILYLLGLNNNKPKIYARKCNVKEIDKLTAKDFLDKNHIQGFVPSTVYIGCFFKEELIGVMTFLKENNDGKWNLTRFASSNEYICNGVGGKLFKYFIRKYSPIEIKSFADRRWTLNKDNNLYVKLGFTLEKVLKPDYRYVFREEYGLNRVHKFNFRKNTLHKKYGFPLTMTESQMTEKLGAYKIWDCGLFKYVWKGNSE